MGKIKDLLSRKCDKKPQERGPMKKALIIGINKYRPDLNADLRGCVNDAENMRHILMSLYGFKPENIRVAIDDRATRNGIISRLKWLCKDVKTGDELVFHYSGHGSQVRDRDGDELNDHLDEILCPYDLNWNVPLTDDILARFFDGLPDGVNFTFFCDSCHSGTMYRSLGNPIEATPRFIMPPFDIRCRSMDQNIPKKIVGSGKRVDGRQRHVLISGCRDDQTSADAHINNKFQGAFTWALTKAIKENPNASYREIHKKVVETLKGKFTQIPQLSGDNDVINRPILGGRK